MAETDFNLLPTMIGSMPHKDARRAVEVVAHYLPDLPAWPQLPLRSPLEGMLLQYSQGFPGLTEKEGRLHVDKTKDLSKQLEAIYTAFLEGRPETFPIDKEHAAGLHDFLELRRLTPVAVKGQVTGPVSLGLAVLDETGKAVLYDETLSDAAAKLLRLKASWQEQELRKLWPRTIVFVDEPGMAAYGSAFFSLAREKVLELVMETLGGISGLSGIHCCGNTDWGLVIATGTDVLSFDAYNYATSLTLYPRDVHGLLARGGAIAWGIVPNTPEALARESAASLKDRLEEAMAPFTRQDIPYATLKERALLTPSCSLAGLDEDGAEQALGLLAELSRKMRGQR